jgi:hypothetical protein
MSTSESPSTAVAVSGPPSDTTIQEFRKLGQANVERVRILGELRKTIAGLTWGDVHGSNLTVQTQHAIAELCRITGANPVLHIDMLGNRPYLKAAFWEDKINSEIRFHHYEQREISPAMEQTLRDRAVEYMALAEELGDTKEGAQAKLRALELREEADEMSITRAKYSPRETAISVVETTIWRFINATPMDKITSGEITDLEPWLVTVTECNWAGGHGAVKYGSMTKYDPIGDANPGTTARTRSLRRCGVKAFSAWMAKWSSQMDKIENMIEAEWEIITSEAEGLPALDEAMSVSFEAGEVTAANSGNAQPLPVEGESQLEPETESDETPDGTDVSEPESQLEPEETFDRDDRRKALFATFNDAGLKKTPERKKWQKEHGFPDSTTKFTEEDFERAITKLMEPWVQEVNEACETLDQDLNDLALAVIGKEEPQFLKDWQALAEVLRSRLESTDL